MPLAPGTRLGPYEIVVMLGAGGMGEVYRARDTRLGRDVALKILPAQISVDPDRHARFEQEARAAAALNHPNILGIYDVGRDDGRFYIAAELVDGEDLASIVAGGPVSVRRLLDIATQIADGMASAHAAGIVHRDLKPANVMIASDGRAKILDFGLAKQATHTPQGSSDALTVHQTEAGVILGTVSYMSPEQARGKPTDHRSDQFSFGLVLYEMATGRKAFDKPESVQTMSAIISDEPPPIEAKIPPPLRWTIDRCLSKEPAGRYESTRDLFHELRSLRDHLSETSTAVTAIAEPAPAARQRRVWLLPAMFLLGVVATLAVIAFRSGPALPDQSAYRFTPFSFEPGGQTSPVWSPDGKAVAYAARADAAAPYQVYLRYLESPTPVQLTHMKDNAYPMRWSADGTRIFLFAQSRPPSIWSIATVGGEPEQVMTQPERGTSSKRAIAITPDGRTVAAWQSLEGGTNTVWLTSPPGSEPRKYAPEPFASKTVRNAPTLDFSPDGKHLLLIVNAGRRDEEMWRLDFPPSGSGGVRQVLPPLRTFGGTPQFAWMPDNRRVVLALEPAPDAALQLWMADTTSGERHAITSGTSGAGTPAVSPDGQRLILTADVGHYDIVSVDLATAVPRKLIATARNELMPAWAAKQPVMVYVSDRNGPSEIWIHRPDNPDRPIVTARDFRDGTTQWLAAPTLSPDASRAIYTRVKEGTTARIWISSVAGGAPIRLTNEDVDEFTGSWSPDGAWFVYCAIGDGKVDLKKVKTTGQATPIVLKRDIPDANVPSWSPDGNWIATGANLVSPDGQTTKPLGQRSGAHYMFSADGKYVYSIGSDRGPEDLLRIDIATGAETVIGNVGREFRPGSNLSPSIRLSLAPDGKSFIYGSGTFTSNLWMLEGFAAKPGLFARFGR
jgi:serine/threonine protein kinase/Tol biopolymer transport system component